MISQNCMQEANQTLDELKQRLNGQANDELFQCLTKNAWIYNCCGDYRTSLDLLQESLRVAKKISPDDHAILGQTHAKIGRCLIRHAKYSDAREQITTARELFLKVTDPNLQQESLVTIENILGVLAREQSQFDRATAHHENAVSLLEGIYPDKKHELFANTYKYLGHSFVAKTQYHDARLAYQSAYAVCRTLPDESDVVCVKVLCSLALVFIHLGYNDSVPQCVELVRALCQKPELSRNATLAALFHSTLARTFLHKKLGDNAWTTSDTAQAIIKNLFGDDDAQSLFLAKYCVVSGDVLVSLCGLQLAMDNYKRAGRIIEKLYSSNHPEMGRIYNQMALGFRRLAHYDRCLQFHTKALGVFSTAYESMQDTSDHALTYSLLGELYNKLQDSTEAHKHNFRSLEMNKRLFSNPMECVPLFKNYINIAQTYMGKAEHKQVELYLCKAKAILSTVVKVGSHHKYNVLWHNLMGIMHREKGNVNRAKQSHEFAKSECFYLYDRADYHIDTSKCIRYLAEVKEKKGKILDASALYEEAYESCDRYEAAENYDGIDSLWIKIFCARLWFRNYEYDTALEELTMASEGLLHILRNDTDHPAYAVIKQMQGEISFKEGAYKKALKLFEEALSINNTVYHTNLNRHDIAVLHSAIGAIYDQFKNFDESLIHYVKALRIISNIHEGTNDILFANALESVGLAYDNVRRPDVAWQFYEAALNMKTKISFGDARKEIAITYMNMGNHLQKNKYTQAANDFYENALQLLKSMPIAETEYLECGALAAQIYKLMGNYHQSKLLITSTMGQQRFVSENMKLVSLRDIVIQSFGERYEYLKRLSKVEREFYQSIAKSFILMGDLIYNKAIGKRCRSYYTEGKIRSMLQEALPFYQQALDLLGRICIREHSSITAIYVKLARIFAHSSIHSPVHALENATVAFTLRKNAYLEINPTHPDVIEACVVLGKIQLSAKLFDDALVNFDWAKERLDAIDDCNEFSTQFELFEGYADRHFVNENYEEAYNLYKQAHEMQVNRFGKFDFHNVELAHSYQNLAKCARKLKKWNEARQHEQVATSILHKSEQSEEQSRQRGSGGFSSPLQRLANLFKK